MWMCGYGERFRYSAVNTLQLSGSIDHIEQHQGCWVVSAVFVIVFVATKVSRYTIALDYGFICRIKRSINQAKHCQRSNFSCHYTHMYIVYGIFLGACVCSSTTTMVEKRQLVLLVVVFFFFCNFCIVFATFSICTVTGYCCRHSTTSSPPMQPTVRH